MFIIQDWAGNVMDPRAMTKHYKVKMTIPSEDFLSEVLGDAHYDEDRQEYYIVEKE